MALMPERQTLLMVIEGTRHRDAALDRGLAGGDLAGAGLDDLAHDHVVDLVAGDAGLVERALDGDAAEVGRRLVLSPPSRRPIGVRAPATMTDREQSDMVVPPSRDVVECRWRRYPPDTDAPGVGAAVRNSSHPLARGRLQPYHDGRMTHARTIPEHLFTAIDHVGIAVPDLDEAIAFYRDVFGMRVLHEETNEEQGVREAMVGVGDSGSCIQLLAPLSAESTIAKFLDRSGPGLQQLAYRVTDVEAGRRRCCASAALRLLYDEPRRGTSDSRINFIHPKDAGGVLVELVEPASLPTH